MSPPTTPTPPLKPPQFSLRTLFVFITVLACISALANFVSPLAMAGILFLMICIAVHVAGNKLGTTLRNHARRQRGGQEAEAHPIVPSQRINFAPTTRLRERKALGNFALLLTLLGISIGAALGVIGTFSLHRSPAAADLLVSGVAGAVLIGMFAFAAAGFVQEISAAAWEASRTTAPHSEQPRRKPDSQAESRSA